ncbi:MAG TPA: hypothetical protein VM223_05765 [Planctomycetota bacterium]|nr:hypothetical protein [Planctomycetota bacterium]
MNYKRCRITAAVALGIALAASHANAWPTEFLQTVDAKIAPQEFADTWGVNPDHVKNNFSNNGTLQVYLVGSTVPANILWPGDKIGFTFQFTNLTDQPVKAAGRVLIIQYQLFTYPDGVFHVGLRKIADIGSAPISVDVQPKGWQDVTVQPEIPDAFGGYGAIIALDGHDKLFGATCVRTFKPNPRPRRFYRLTMDMGEIDALKRIGATVNRIGIGYKPTTDKDFDEWFKREGEQLMAYKEAGLPLTVEIGGGAFRHPNQPLGRERPWLDDKDVMMQTKFDLAWLPSYDDDFRKFCKLLFASYGWPKGPINGVMLWNEPWNGISISGWGADDERYREIYTAMALGVEDARKEAGVQVWIGGCDSSSNTFDKFFGDGSKDFLKWLDFMSVHYQGTDPCTNVKLLVDRTDAAGEPAPVEVWDTESWVANSDDRIAGVLSAMYSFGQKRVVGINSDCMVEAVQWRNVQTAAGAERRTERRKILQTWSAGAAVGAFQHFVGERAFREMLFKNGLPFVMMFDGETPEDGTADPEDGTVVIVGDLGAVFGFDNVLFRTCRSKAEVEQKESIRQKLAKLAADDPARAELEKQLAAPMPYTGATMTIAAKGDTFSLHDFYGNPVPAVDGKIVVPLDARGFYLRGNGKPGSFAALLDAVRAGRVEGMEPLAVACRDMTSPIGKDAAVRVELTNVLNRPIKGKLTATLGTLRVQAPDTLSFGPQETQTVAVKVVGGEPTPSNLYPLRMVFDAGADGKAVHEEEMRVNVIAKRTITVDGKLDDWQDAIPQQIRIEGVQQATLMEKAWLPFVKFDESVKKGFAVGYAAYDDRNFYFAAKVTDTTPDGGTVRFETRDDSQFFYPEKCYSREKDGSLKEYTWPEAVRRFTYRRNPVLPAGNAPNFDNVQIGFNVLPEKDKPYYPFPPGTMRGYVGTHDTDYEYALNSVAEQYGGGTEIWRLRYPGMPHKHFYPRQPASPQDGPVKAGKLVVTHEGSTRIAECAIPWSEIPGVRRKLDAGEPIKFSFRINDNAGVGCMELSKGRSVAKRNGSFMVDWVEHWSNELEFGWEK